MIFESSPESLEALESAVAAGLGILVPPPDLTVSAWSDLYAQLPRESSAMPGQWVTANAEYQRGFMDVFNDPTVETIVVMWGAQTGKSAGLLNMIGYVAHQDPAPILMVQPTLEKAEDFSKERIAPMIRITPTITHLFGDPRAKDSGNTLRHKQFPGGYLALSGANSAASLSSRPVRFLFCDEVDKYDASAGTEGDPVDLARARTASYWNRKIVLTSTPNIKGESRIEEAYLQSDRRRYYVPCPQCGEYIMLEWAQLRWPSPRTNPALKAAQPDECYYVCQANGCEITEADKPAMVAAGEWRATAVSEDGRTAGFHLNSLYSSFLSWPDLARQWIRSQGNPESLKTFINSQLAETFARHGEGIEKDIFAGRQMDYPEDADAPAGVLVVTAGIDVQGNRIEATAWGWAVGEESWALEHRLFAGSPSELEVWAELEGWLKRTYKREDGVSLQIRRSLIDSGGHHTKQVYAFAKRMQKRGIYACVGRANNGGQPKPLLSKPTTGNDAGVLLYTVGVDTAKENFYGRLKIDKEGAGYCHFPRPAGERFKWADAEFFAQLTAEHLVPHKHGGIITKKWEKKRDRNEALDMRVYAMAALELLNPNFAKWERELQKRAALVGYVPPPEPRELGSPDGPPMQMPKELRDKIERARPFRPKKPGGWVNAWR